MALNSADYFTVDKVENLKLGVSHFIHIIKFYSVALGVNVCSLVFISPWLCLNVLVLCLVILCRMQISKLRQKPHKYMYFFFTSLFF